MVAEKFIPIEPDSEVDRLIMQASERPIVTASHGMRFRIVREPGTERIANHDVERLLRGLRESAGAFSPEFDVEAFKEELREQRDQDSAGRPGN